jgi:hypothetical protein
MRPVQAPDLQRDAAVMSAYGAFATRPPSQAWERVAAAGCPGGYAWVWFKPATVPQGLILRIPDEAYAGNLQPETSAPDVSNVRESPAALWTMRQLLQAAGVEPAHAAMWVLYGAAYDGMAGASPYLDAPIPAPAAGADPNIVVYVHVPYVEAMPLAIAPPAPVAQSAAELFERMEADWAFILELEKELSRLRKMLQDLLTKLKSLNRDLTAVERLHSNRQDKDDWFDARRWLRDGSTRLIRCIKEHDIGDTSTAGQRKWFEQAYNKYVVPRQPFEGMIQTQRDFEAYRKLVQNLHGNMNTAYSIASTNGERRAQQVLNRIAAKVRAASTKASFLGTIID